MRTRRLLAALTMAGICALTAREASAQAPACGPVPGTGCLGGPVLACTGPPQVGQPWGMCLNVPPGAIGFAMLQGIRPPFLPDLPLTLFALVGVPCVADCTLAGVYPLLYWAVAGGGQTCLSFGGPPPAMLGYKIWLQGAYYIPLAGCWTLTNAIKGTVVP